MDNQNAESTLLLSFAFVYRNEVSVKKRSSKMYLCPRRAIVNPCFIEIRRWLEKQKRHIRTYWQTLMFANFFSCKQLDHELEISMR